MSRSDDEQHLKLLSVFHYVISGLVGLFSLFSVIYIAMGLAIVYAPEKFLEHQGEAPPEFFGWVVAGMGCVLLLFGLALAASVLLAGRSLASRTRHTYCLVVAGIECLFMPFGTILGVFTIVVLMRDSVKVLFQAIPAEGLWLTERDHISQPTSGDSTDGPSL